MTGRSRYVRLFPERVYFLLARLTDREVVAYLRVVNDYVVRDGQVQFDDKALAKVAGISSRAWSDLRDKLVELGIVKVDGDKFVDPDQSASLEIQRATSERQRGNAMRRWKR